MKQKLISGVILASVLSSSCRKLPGTCAVVKSANNKVSCKVDYSRLSAENMVGITINDIGIPQNEKIRHLNELNAMPREFLNVMRYRITINMTDGGITNLPDYANLKGVMPRGWPAGSTWDMVPGAGGHDGLALGNSVLSNNAWSLAIHEATHSVDSQTRFTSLKEFQDAYSAEKSKPHPQDSNASYRTSFPEEYLAIAVDEYYCSPETKSRLKQQYPKAYALVENNFTRLLAASGKQKEPIGVPAPTPVPAPQAVPAPMTKPSPLPAPQSAPNSKNAPKPSTQTSDAFPAPQVQPGPTQVDEGVVDSPSTVDPTSPSMGSSNSENKLPTTGNINNTTMRVDPVFVHRREIPNDSWCD